MKELTDVMLRSNINLIEKDINEGKKYLSNLQRDVSKQQEYLTESRFHLKKYKNELESRKDQAFKEKVFKEHGGNLPARSLEKIWSKAWEDGHAYGLEEVETHFIELVELLN